MSQKWEYQGVTRMDNGRNEYLRASLSATNISGKMRENRLR